MVLVVQNLPANAGDPGSILGRFWVRKIPWWRMVTSTRYCNPLQYSWLENPMDTGAWQATVYGTKKSQTGLRTKKEILSLIRISLRRWPFTDNSFLSHGCALGTSLGPWQLHVLQRYLLILLGFGLLRRKQKISAM